MSLRKLDGVWATWLSVFVSVIGLVHYSTKGLRPIRAARETIEFTGQLSIRPKTLERVPEKHWIGTDRAGRGA